MKFHDQIAFRAILDGEKSTLYRHAAQKHANATWVYLMIAVLVWHFANLWWALIPFALGVFTALQSVSATFVAQRLEKHETQ